MPRLHLLTLLCLSVGSCADPAAIPTPDLVPPSPAVPDPSATPPEDAGFLLINSGSVIAIGCERGAVCVSALVRPTTSAGEPRFTTDFFCTCTFVWASVTLTDVQGNDYWSFSYGDGPRAVPAGVPARGRIDMGYLPNGQFPTNIISVPVLVARLR